MASHEELVQQFGQVSLENDRENYRMNRSASADVTELLNQDAQDESLARYKENLLGKSTVAGDLGNTKDERKVVLQEFQVVFEDGSSTVILNTNIQDHQTELGKLQMKEGTKYRLKIVFNVQHSIVTGLRFNFKVKKSFLSKSEDIMMGSYGPRTEPHIFQYPRHSWLQAPQGKLTRGDYKSSLALRDSDENQHLHLEFTFKIVKNV